ncbi:MAP kinase kinase 9 [Tasmannia lanceolata]|uniref:MAP kinase kinase 9 n=1 Tax=Tasmannia lanceolata TaxID=3420 RepID=UPI0040636CA2
MGPTLFPISMFLPKPAFPTFLTSLKPLIKPPPCPNPSFLKIQEKQKKKKPSQAKIKHIAVMRERRQLNLKLPLPLPVPETSDRRPRFPLPLPPNCLTTRSQEIERLSDLEKIQVLGHGNGGTVYKVRHKRTSAVYALKIVHGDCENTVRRQIFREMEILKRTDSPYVVRCHGIFERSGGDIGLVMEYMDGGTLETLLQKNGTFSEKSLSGIAKQVLEGMSYLHSHKIVHRDIKPSNLLVNRKMEVKIADFGVSKIMCRTLDPCDSYVGTCAYMSPERFDPGTYGGNYDGYAGDIWSLGLTLLELYIGHFPLLSPGQRPDWSTLMCAICFGEPPSIPATASHDFRDFITCCLQKESIRRWSVAKLLAHPFIVSDRGLIADFERISISSSS